MPRKMERLVEIQGIMHRICCTCKVPKLLGEYSKELWRGQQAKCRACTKAYLTAYHAMKGGKPVKKAEVLPAPKSVLRPNALKATLRTSKFYKYASAE